jgi:hypothetical protein
MLWIPGSNNGEWGLNMARGAVFPANIGGPLGFRGNPLPINLQLPTPTIDKPYFTRSFGTVYQLTPGGVTTESGWGFKNKGFGRRRRSNSTKKHRCKAIKKDGKRCKHKTVGNFCKHHLKQKKRRKSRS